MELKIILALFACVIDGAWSWENSWDGPFEFICPYGQSIRRVTSVHSNHHEDRQWKFECMSTGATVGCHWSGYVNAFDMPVLFQCPNNGVITGISSFHDNSKEDRRFKFHCCSIPRQTLTNCRFSRNYANDFDGYLNFYVPGKQVLRGVFSHHINSYEDRRWKFEVCDKPLSVLSVDNYAK